MSGKTLLKIAARRDEPRSTPEHERFKYLIAQIERIRKTHKDVDAAILEFRQSDAQTLQPLRVNLRNLTRETVFQLDRLLDERGWTRAELAGLESVLCGNAELLLQSDPYDEQIRDLFDKHSRVSFDEMKEEELLVLKEHVEELGFDLGDDTDIRTEEDLVQRMYEQLGAKRQQEEARRESRSRGRKKSAAQTRAEANAQAAKQFLREIYRKLASIVHPDRETDAQRRAEKTELMQRINRAYATDDLLTLLEAQLALEQIDPEQIGRLSRDRLKQYNRLLAKQLEAEKSELFALEEGFRADFHLGPRLKITRENLRMLLRERTREIRAHIEQQRYFLEVLADRMATKRWLRQRAMFAF
jgi:hypothetical protein